MEGGRGGRATVKVADTYAAEMRYQFDRGRLLFFDLETALALTQASLSMGPPRLYIHSTDEVRNDG